MDRIYTRRDKSLHSAKMFSFLFFIFLSLSFYSCSSPAQENMQKESDNEDIKSDSGEKVFSFHRLTNGKDVLWKAVFKDGKVAELYKNGKKIPQENIDDYQDMVNDELSDLEFYQPEFPRRNFRFRFDRGALDSSMKQLRESLSHKDFSWVDSAFNSEKFRSEMDSLKENLRGLKRIRLCLPDSLDFHFDSAAFNRGMRELKENLENMKFDHHDFECDMGAFREGMKKFREEMKHNRFNSEDFKIDMKDFSHQMKKFKEEMKDFHLNMENFKSEMKKLKSFLKDVRVELVKDNIIKSEDESFKLKMDSEEMFINGKKVPDNLFKKYKEIYKKNFGKEIEHEINFNTD